MRKALLGAGVLVAVAVGFAVWRGTTIGADLAFAMHRAIELCREAGPLAFFSAMALFPMFGFPLAPFTLAAGPAFGPTMGVGPVIVCAMVAVAINVALSYWIAAHVLRPHAAKLAAWLGYRLPSVQGQSAWVTTLLLRIVPGPPFFLQSYLLGLARVPFSIYICVSVLVPLGYITSIILFGDALAEGNAKVAVAAVGFMLVIGAIIHFVRKRLSRPAAVIDGKE